MTHTFTEALAEADRLHAADRALPASVRLRLGGRESSFATQARKAEAHACETATLRIKSFPRAVKAWVAAAGAGGGMVFADPKPLIEAPTLEALVAALEAAWEKAADAESAACEAAAGDNPGSWNPILPQAAHPLRGDKVSGWLRPPPLDEASLADWRAKPLTGIRWVSSRETIVDLTREGSIWVVTAEDASGRPHLNRTLRARAAMR